MKKFLLISLTLVSTSSYSQNIVNIARNIRLKPVTIQRTIKVPIGRGFDALNVARQQQIVDRHVSYNFNNTSEQIHLHLERQLIQHTLKSPQSLYGSYNYLRAFSKVSDIEILTTNKYRKDWDKINATQGYNGVHHIVNKYTLKLIHQTLKQQGIKFNLDEAQKNAPALFHPLHGNPKFQYIFHNPLEQYELYFKYGMKYVLLSKIDEINRLNIEMGLKPLKDDVILGLILETELWCKYHGLKWE